METRSGSTRCRECSPPPSGVAVFSDASILSLRASSSTGSALLTAATFEWTQFSPTGRMSGFVVGDLDQGLDPGETPLDLGDHLIDFLARLVGARRDVGQRLPDPVDRLQARLRFLGRRANARGVDGE